MDVSITELNNFQNYFRGNTRFFGRYLPPKEETIEGEKQKGKSWTEKKELLRPEDYRDHLNGKKGLGIIPIDHNNNVRFCVIDIDVYPLNVKKYQDIINTLDLPFLICRSKSGGAHLYLFFSEDVKAEKIVPIMKQWALVFGLPESTEVFPKQKRIRADQAGNWINLPYFGESRRMIDADCQEMPLSLALHAIERKLLTLDLLKGIYDDLPLSDGPPCLQSLYITGDPNQYEMYLFNIAIYYKSAFPNTWEEKVIEASDRLYDPLPIERVQSQVLNGQENKTYTYRCSEDPICSRCDRNTCETRKYGKGGDVISDFSFEEMTQVLSDPPHYKWIVNGSTMTFYSESDLRNQERFADYCMRNLHKVPNKIKSNKWVAVLNKAFSDLKVEKIDLIDDMSTGSILAGYVYEYLLERPMAKTKEQLAQRSRVYLDEDLGELHFKPKDVLKFILMDKNFKYYAATEVQARIKKYGARPSRLYINTHLGSTRTWSMPLEKAQALGEATSTDTVIDFKGFMSDDEKEF